MLTIRHRVNDIDSLIRTPKNMGVEIDIRSSGDDIILNHDPFQKGTFFEDWLKNFEHNFIILNTKEDGLEEKIIKYLENFNINDYFFLDQPFPTILKTITKGCNKIALRFSEYETTPFLENMAGKCEWVWIDSFYKYSHDLEVLKKIKEMGYKLCFVSPELQGRNNEKERIHILNACKELKADAICTKF
tara:strand:- start:220 stop:786 length:567 start_codon:yes stop_codon:yes gene_type:complete